jgi:signal transduction histidine kinase
MRFIRDGIIAAAFFRKRMMLWSIRNQILVPLVAIQGVAVATVAVTAATLAARRSEQQITGRLNGVIDTLGHSNFPYTPAVLTKMRGLSGAHFAVYTEDGQVNETTLPTLKTVPSAVRAAPPLDRLDSLTESSTLLLDGTHYFAVPLQTSGGARDSSLLVLYPETSWRQARWEAAAPPLAMGLGTLGLMAAVTGWIAHRISGRIHDLQRRVARIAAGDFKGFDPGQQSDEVQQLARSMNSMAGQLNQMQETIRQSERTRLLAQLAAGLAHQLRNSLTGAKMNVELHTKRFPPSPGDQTLDIALRQLAITEEQLKRLLSLGRVERQPQDMCELATLLGDVAMLVGPSCQHAGVRLSYPAENGRFRIAADEAGLRAAILNLAMNALEAAGPGGEVSLGASAKNGNFIIEVSDTGPGPPPEVAESLFEPFVTSKPEGVGLGLALARRVAVEHGGQLAWIRDGERTRFRLTLPTTNGPASEAT